VEQRKQGKVKILDNHRGCFTTCGHYYRR